MTAYFSPSTARFYDLEIYGSNMPDDAFQITEETRQELLMAQSAGKQIVTGNENLPIAIDRPGPTPEQKIASERFWRDSQLRATDALVQRHRDEIDGGWPASLTGEQYQQVQAYRMELRGWPAHADFPDSTKRPAAPVWMGS